MPILLPVAGLSISLMMLLAVGGVVGSLSGLFGVGGGFLITPILMMIGVPPTVAAASGSCQMVATSSSGMAAHSRQGNVDVKMGIVLLAGGLVGAELGVRAIEYLHTLGEASFTIELSYILVLGSLGSYMFIQSLQTLRRGALARKGHEIAKGEGRLSWLPWQMDFPRSGVRHSILVPLFLSLIIGILASIMGVGGGFIMLPMMVYLLGMPTHIAVGTSLFQILFLCAGVTYMQAATNQTVDLLLVLPLALGSAFGAQIGARVSRFLRGEQLMILLATIVLVVTGEMTSKIITPPASFLRPPSVMHGRGTTTPADNHHHAGAINPRWDERFGFSEAESSLAFFRHRTFPSGQSADGTNLPARRVSPKQTSSVIASASLRTTATRGHPRSIRPASYFWTGGEFHDGRALRRFWGTWWDDRTAIRSRASLMDAMS